MFTDYYVFNYNFPCIARKLIRAQHAHDSILQNYVYANYLPRKRQRTH